MHGQKCLCWHLREPRGSGASDTLAPINGQTAGPPAARPRGRVNPSCAPGAPPVRPGRALRVVCPVVVPLRPEGQLEAQLLPPARPEVERRRRVVQVLPCGGARTAWGVSFSVGGAGAFGGRARRCAVRGGSPMVTPGSQWPGSPPGASRDSAKASAAIAAAVAAWQWPRIHAVESWAGKGRGAARERASRQQAALITEARLWRWEEVVAGLDPHAQGDSLEPRRGAALHAGGRRVEGRRRVAHSLGGRGKEGEAHGALLVRLAAQGRRRKRNGQQQGAPEARQEAASSREHSHTQKGTTRLSERQRRSPWRTGNRTAQGSSQFSRSEEVYTMRQHCHACVVAGNILLA